MRDERFTPLRIVIDLTGMTADQLLRLARLFMDFARETIRDLYPPKKEKP